MYQVKMGRTGPTRPIDDPYLPSPPRFFIFTLELVCFIDFCQFLDPLKHNWINLGI